MDLLSGGCLVEDDKFLWIRASWDVVDRGIFLDELVEGRFQFKRSGGGQPQSYTTPIQSKAAMGQSINQAGVPCGININYPVLSGSGEYAVNALAILTLSGSKHATRGG